MDKDMQIAQQKQTGIILGLVELKMWKTLILASLPVLIDYYVDEYMKEDLRNTFDAKSSNYYLPHVESFDFIVVGAGAAGCVLASRLSEHPNTSVLLLESGGNPPPQIDIPAFSVADKANVHNRNILYEYFSVPQKYANNSIIKSIHGKIMGGSTAINGMGFNRGNPKDFDNWALLTNDTSWSYDSVLQYFKNIEDYKGEFPVESQHGTGGPMTVSKQDFAPGRREWFAAGLEKRHQTRDPNGPQMPSFAPFEFNKKNGRRQSSYAAYIKPVENERPNLKIIRYATATEILIDEDNNAYGVMYQKHDTYNAAFATKEVIVSAGTYGSPQLLMKSGIGPAAVLKSAKILMKMDLPVGRNYKEHPLLTLRFFTDDKSIVLDPNTEYNQSIVDDFEKNGTGPLTSYRGLTGQAFLSSSVAVSDKQKDWPDYQFTLTSGDWSNSKNTNPTEFPLYHNIFVTRPKSVGYVSIDPVDVTSPPIIDYNFLHDKRDIQIFMDAIKMSLELYEKTSVYKNKVKYINTPVYACKHLRFRSDAYWECYIRNGLASGLHPAGTCSMGRNPSDPKAVVDSKLRVIGVTGLRVADASIMPEITNANTQAPVYMIAEKTSAEIKSTWGL